MASNKKKAQAEDIIEKETTAEEMAEKEDLTDENAEEMPDEPVETEVAEVIDNSPEAIVPTDLHARLVKSLRLAVGPEKVHALNQLELLTGHLKMLLPSAIRMVEEEELKEGLVSLLGLL